MNRTSLLVLSVLLASCAKAPTEVAATPTGGKQILESVGRVGTQVMNLTVTSRQMRLRLEATGSTGINVQLTLRQTKDATRPPRAYSVASDPGKPSEKTVSVEPGTYEATIETTGSYRLEIEEVSGA